MLNGLSSFLFAFSICTGYEFRLILRNVSNLETKATSIHFHRNLSGWNLPLKLLALLDYITDVIFYRKLIIGQ